MCDPLHIDLTACPIINISNDKTVITMRVFHTPISAGFYDSVIER